MFTMTTDTQDINPEDIKDRIRAVATSLFANSGFNGVSIREICEASECNLAAISYYFGGKEKLYEECLNSIKPEVLKEFDGILKSSHAREDFEKRLLQFCCSLSNFINQNADAVKLLIDEINSASGNKIDLNFNFLSPVLSRMESFFLDGISNKLVNPEIDPKLVSRMIFTIMVTQLLYKNFKPFEEITSEDLSIKVIRICTGSFYV